MLEGYEIRIHFPFQKQKAESGYFAFKCDQMQTQQWFLSDISRGGKKLPETSKITSEYKVGLGLSEIGEFENCSVVKHLFLA